MATMRPSSPSTCGIRGRGSEKPVRAHAGMTPWSTGAQDGVAEVAVAGAGDSAAGRIAISPSGCRVGVHLRGARGSRQLRPRHRRYACRMCRNIRPLHNFEPAATDDEVRAAALQYVRKISGTTKPSRANAEAFDRAVAEVAAASARLLDSLITTAPPRDREV